IRDILSTGLDEEVVSFDASYSRQLSRRTEWVLGGGYSEIIDAQVSGNREKAYYGQTGVNYHITPTFLGSLAYGHYNRDSENVIDSIPENTLPISLRKSFSVDRPAIAQWPPDNDAARMPGRRPSLALTVCPQLLENLPREFLVADDELGITVFITFIGMGARRGCLLARPSRVLKAFRGGGAENAMRLLVADDLINDLRVEDRTSVR